MKKLLAGLAVGLMMFGMTGVANSQVLAFDDITVASSDIIPSGYGGLIWTNMGVINPILVGFDVANSGYKNGTVSLSYTAFNVNGYAGEVTSAVNDFDFNGVFLTGAWRDNLQIMVQGFDDYHLKYNTTVTASAFTATYFSFNYLDVDKLIFSSYGGTDAGFYVGSGSDPLMSNHFAMDNFTFNESQQPVPEPATMLLFGAGIAGLAAARRKKKKAC